MEPRPGLLRHELFFLLSFCLFLLVLSLLSSLSLKEESPPFESCRSYSSLIEVSITGAVREPGVYRLPQNSTVSLLVSQSILLPIADKSGLEMNRKLIDGDTIHVEEKGWIEVILKGETKDLGVFRILSGSLLSELIAQIELTEEANLKSFKKKDRFLKNGEVITIPSKRKRRCKLPKNQKAIKASSSL